MPDQAALHRTPLCFPVSAAFDQRIEDGLASVCCRLYDIEDVAHRNAAPFGDAGPSLNAKMLGDLFLLRHLLDLGIGERLWALDQPAHAELVIREAALH